MKLSNIQHIAVVGLGRMGHGIAQTFAAAGYTVSGYDSHAPARQTLHQRIHSNLDDFARAGLVEAGAIGEIVERVTVADSEEAAVRDAQFVVEAIAEQVDVKQEYFARVEEFVDDATILASNSSTITISESGKALRHPQRALVTHWFNPPHIVPTVEVVGSEITAAEVVSATIQLHRKIGKLAVRVNAEIPGFLVNRVQVAMVREVWDLYERGVASAADIDAAIRGSLGFRLAACGPLAICDFGGLDIWRTVYQQLAPDIRSDNDLPQAVDALVESGQLGTRSGSGFHQYEDVDQVTRERDEIMLKLAKLLADWT